MLDLVSLDRRPVLVSPGSGRLKQQKCIARRAGGWKSEIRASVGWLFPGVSLLGWQRAVFSLSSPVCVRVPISSWRDTSHTGLGSSPMTSFELN